MPTKTNENLLTDEYLNKLLNNIEEEKSYYVGGSLCIDSVEKVVVVNLDGTYSFFADKPRKIMNNENLKLVFNIYKRFKGETEYYKEKITDAKTKGIMV